MPNKFANRRSPSGPGIVVQMGFGNVQPVDGGATEYVLSSGIGSSGPGYFVAIPTGVEDGTEYEVPVAGKLDTLQVRNNPVGADVVNVVYQARKNHVDVGAPVILAANVVGPVKVDLSGISVFAGDLISLSVTALGGLPGAKPWSRVLFTYAPSTSVIA